MPGPPIGLQLVEVDAGKETGMYYIAVGNVRTTARAGLRSA